MMMVGLAVGSECNGDLFPIYSGGKRDEYANCIVYDSRTEQILIGGNSTSSDYAKLGNGPFLYALDLQGHWQWGFSFENQTNIIADISGCSMASDGKALTLLGSNFDSSPTIIEVDPQDG